MILFKSNDKENSMTDKQKDLFDRYSRGYDKNCSCPGCKMHNLPLLGYNYQVKLEGVQELALILTDCTNNEGLIDYISDKVECENCKLWQTVDGRALTVGEVSKILLEGEIYKLHRLNPFLKPDREFATNDNVVNHLSQYALNAKDNQDLQSYAMLLSTYCLEARNAYKTSKEDAKDFNNLMDNAVNTYYIPHKLNPHKEVEVEDVMQ